MYKVEDAEEMRKLLEEDPARDILAYAVVPMARGVVGHEVRYPDLRERTTVAVAPQQDARNDTAPSAW